MVRKILGSLMQKRMKVSFLDSHNQVKHIEYIISVYLLLKNLSMFLLMSLNRKMSEKVFLLMTQVYLQKTYSRKLLRKLINPEQLPMRRRKILVMKKMRKKGQLK